MTMEAVADTQQSGETAVSESETQQITLTQVAVFILTGNKFCFSTGELIKRKMFDPSLSAFSVPPSSICLKMLWFQSLEI